MNKTDIEVIDSLIKENQKRLRVIKKNFIMRYATIFISIILFFVGGYEYKSMKVINIIALLLVAISHSIDVKTKHKVEVFLGGVYRVKSRLSELRD